MDWTPIVGKFAETYGIPGIVIIGMALALNKVWNAYTAEVAARHADNKTAVTAIERNTQVLTALSELVKERRR